MRPATAALSPPALKILTDVEDYGMHVLHVPEDDKKPGGSFSVGLWHTFEQPEVIVFGLPPLGATT